MNRRRTLPGAALLLCAAALPAQQPGPVLDLQAGEYPVARLLELASRQLRCSILINPALLRDLPAVRLDQAVRAEADAAADVFADLLFRSNLALLPADASLRLFDVIALDGPRARELQGHASWRPAAAILQHPERRVMVATVVPLQRIAARDVQMALRVNQRQVPPGLALTCGPTATGTAIVLIGWQPQVAEAIASIQKMDQGAAPSTPAEQLQARLAALDKQVAGLEQRCAEMEKQEGAKRSQDR